MRAPLGRAPLGYACLVAATLVAGASSARAQFPRRRGGSFSNEPGWWVGVSYGFMQPGNVNDGSSGSTWDFGYTSVTSAELAKSINGGTVGVLMNFATAPLTYTGSVACPASCSAHGDITQIML